MFKLCFQVLVVLFAQDFPKPKNVERPAGDPDIALSTKS